MSTRRLPEIRVGAIIAVSALIAFGVWLALRQHGPTSNTTPTLVSALGLETVAATLTQPIYWAGPQGSARYELTRTTDGTSDVRYLPDAASGTNSSYLTVATYPRSDAFAATTAAAVAPGSVKLAVGGGGVAFYGASNPTNVYEAFPGSKAQIEVYAPAATLAQQVVAQGQIVPVPTIATAAAPTTAGTNPVAVTLGFLRAKAKSLGRPLYWVGAKPGVTYEFTETSNGDIYLRYLPPGVKAGSRLAYETIATYPVANAFAVTSTRANLPGTVKIPISGGVAFYSSAEPKSVYIAFQGSNEQLQVYDPSPARAHQLVAAGALQPVP